MGRALAIFGCEAVSQLQYRVLHDPEVFPALLDTLTIRVTEMFRDPGYFLAIRQHVTVMLPSDAVRSPTPPPGLYRCASAAR